MVKYANICVSKKKEYYIHTALVSLEGQVRNDWQCLPQGRTQWGNIRRREGEET